MKESRINIDAIEHVLEYDPKTSVFGNIFDFFLFLNKVCLEIFLLVNLNKKYFSSYIYNEILKYSFFLRKTQQSHLIIILKNRFQFP